jgi:peptide deformylase
MFGHFVKSLKLFKVGLAAPQVNISKQLIMITIIQQTGINVKPLPPTPFFNPQIEYLVI